MSGRAPMASGRAGPDVASLAVPKHDDVFAWLDRWLGPKAAIAGDPGPGCGPPTPWRVNR